MARDPVLPTREQEQEKGKRKAETTSRQNETISFKLQLFKNAKAALDTTPSPQHSCRGASTQTAPTETQDLTSSKSAAASQLVPPEAEADAPTTPVLTTIVFGSDECRKLGLSLKKKATPAAVSDDHFPPSIKIVQVAAGDNGSFVLTSQHWLGVRIGILKEICDFASTTLDPSSDLKAGQHSSLAPEVVWGRLDGGQLGIQFSAQQLRDELLIHQDEHGRPRICLRPTAVLNLGQVNHVACGINCTVFIDEKGRAYAIESGSSGQLGLGSEADQSVPQGLHRKMIDERNLV
ncbi:hypothetical protein J3E69DRAFT_380624 [Trichoderma sp. SZMC 28015]